MNLSSFLSRLSPCVTPQNICSALVIINCVWKPYALVRMYTEWGKKSTETKQATTITPTRWNLIQVICIFYCSDFFIDHVSFRLMFVCTVQPRATLITSRPDCIIMLTFIIWVIFWLFVYFYGWRMNSWGFAFAELVGNSNNTNGYRWTYYMYVPLTERDTSFIEVFWCFGFAFDSLTIYFSLAIHPQ